MAPVIHELNKLSSDLEVLVYNTGQHYDQFMSEVFFNQLRIPEPDVVFQQPEESWTPAERIANMIWQASDWLQKHKPDMVVVEGDTDTTLALAFAGVKAGVRVAHIEAGCRIHDTSLPEELNRTLTADLASLHFAPTKNCKQNLIKEGIWKDSIHMLGHPIVDSIELVKPRLTEEEIDLGKRGAPLPKLEPRSYFFVTLHRDFNVDDPIRLERILKELAKIEELTDKRVIFPIHPRTSKRIHEFDLGQYLNKFIPMMPVGYVTSLALTKYAYAVISDSGGLQKESAIFGTPMITMRPNTEWTETLGEYANQLAFCAPPITSILNCIKELEQNYDMAREAMQRRSIFLGKPGVAKAIAEKIKEVA